MSERAEGTAERSPRAIVVLMMALVGAMFFFVFIAEDITNMTDLEWADLPWGLILRYVLAMGAGGALAGALAAGLFGRAGLLGWLLALLGGVIAVVLAGLMGSAIGLLPDLLRDGWQTADLIPVLFGLLVVPMAAAGEPLVGAALIGLIALTHFLARRRRRPAGSGPGQPG